MTTRFFVPPTWIDGERARLEGKLARQVSRVLRMAPGDEVTLLDNSGREFAVLLTQFDRDRVEGVVQAVSDTSTEPAVELTLYQALLKGERFEWVLQKGTELGVKAFVPVMCQRSIPTGQGGGHRLRDQRWRRIVTEAAEQSGRSLLPRLEEATPFNEACEATKGTGLSLIPWEHEGTASLRPALQRASSSQINVFIGPEGGFEEIEVEYARSHGVLPVSLGRRILRSETAAIVTVASVLYEMGELGR